MADTECAGAAGKVMNGKIDVSRRPLGRRYASSVLGMNLVPYSSLWLEARNFRRYALTCVHTWSRLETPMGPPNLA